MEDIVYDCPNCLTHYVVWDSSMPPITAERSNDLWEVVRKQIDEVGSCKRCVRKDPAVPTTLEMDGLFTEKDIKDRFTVMKPCIECGKYTAQNIALDNKPCQYCKGDMAISSTHWYSVRTWSISKRLSPADRKKLGGKR